MGCGIGSSAKIGHICHISYLAPQHGIAEHLLPTNRYLGSWCRSQLFQGWWLQGNMRSHSCRSLWWLCPLQILYACSCMSKPGILYLCVKCQISRIFLIQSWYCQCWCSRGVINTVCWWLVNILPVSFPDRVTAHFLFNAWLGTRIANVTPAIPVFPLKVVYIHGAHAAIWRQMMYAAKCTNIMQDIDLLNRLEARSSLAALMVSIWPTLSIPIWPLWRFPEPWGYPPKGLVYSGTSDYIKCPNWGYLYYRRFPTDVSISAGSSKHDHVAVAQAMPWWRTKSTLPRRYGRLGRSAPFFLGGEL